jgi:hypothetical protein
MRKCITGMLIFFPFISFSQTLVKAGAGVANRWNEKLNTQSLGKGFRVMAEQYIVPRLSVGMAVSYFTFNPNRLVNVRFNSYSLQWVYYFNTKRWQPYLGTGVGYTHYTDNTTLELGAGNRPTQKRKKNYGVIAPFLGIQYEVSKKQKTAIFLQCNTDFVPVARTQPIGFLSVAAGISCRLHHK